MIKNLGQRKLSKTGSHRKAMFSNMAASLLMSEGIRTTVPKAKGLRRVVERIITSAKKGKHPAVRRVIKNRTAYKKLFEVLAPRYQNRPGGYLRILRLGRRKGDNAEVALVKLVE
ncbi:MAG: 50S ribosomal protein L17 [Elusimicrobia bacterium]|nr:50S ribosomal protein L17 [Elusimicrobiota bacterium]